MRVVIDGRGISNQLDGIGRYSLNLITRLVEGADDVAFEVLVRDDLRPDIRDQFSACAQTFSVPYPHISPRTLFGMGGLVDRFRADLYHSLFFFQPLFMRTPGILTIHDTMWVQNPGLQAAGRPLTLVCGWLYYRSLVEVCVRKTRMVVAVSGATEQDILKCMPWAQDKVTVIGEGLDTRFTAPPVLAVPETDVGALDRDDVPFFLHVSNSKPYKNTSRLVEAFARVAPLIGHSLVIVGRSSAFSGQVRELVRTLDLQDRVRFLGNVEDGELATLMTRATSLLFPSVYEGFGLPVLEAMASGCPVMTSNRGGLREVAGNAALTVDPFSVESMAQGMLEMANNEGLRERLKQSGFSQASKFKWADVVKSVLDMYGGLLEGKRGRDLPMR